MLHKVNFKGKVHTRVKKYGKTRITKAKTHQQPKHRAASGHCVKQNVSMPWCLWNGCPSVRLPCASLRWPVRCSREEELFQRRRIARGMTALVIVEPVTLLIPRLGSSSSMPRSTPCYDRSSNSFSVRVQYVCSICHRGVFDCWSGQCL